MSRLLIVREVAEVLRLAESTVVSKLRSGEIAGIRISGRNWRVDPEALRQYIARNQSATTTA
jgi:excisionase family DNA binding protein